MLIVPQLANRLPAFYGNRRFITAFTKDYRWSTLNQIIAVHIFPNNLLDILFNIVLLSISRSSKQLFSSGIVTKTLFAFLFSPIRPTCAASSILLNSLMPNIRPSYPGEQRESSKKIYESGCCEGEENIIQNELFSLSKVAGDKHR